MSSMLPGSSEEKSSANIVANILTFLAGLAV